VISDFIDPYCVGARDAAITFGLPFISGKDSLNNEFSMSPEEAKRTGLPDRIAIPYTLLISAMGVIKDVRQCVSMDLEAPGNYLVLASEPVSRGTNGLERAREMHHRVASLIAAGKVRAAHDVSDGGLAVAVAEMSIASNLGITVDVKPGAYSESIFAPVPTTYVLEMTEADAAACHLPIIGRVEADPRVRIKHDGVGQINLSTADLAETWRAPLAQGGGR
jgi:phosphoribosylformylglycinamidine synthase